MWMTAARIRRTMRSWIPITGIALALALIPAHRAGAINAPTALHSHNSYFAYLFYLQTSPFTATSARATGVQLGTLMSYGSTYQLAVLNGEDGTEPDFENPYSEQDAESMYTEWHMSLGMWPSARMGVRLLHVLQYGGFMDSTIIGFHELFGFPGAGREYRPRDQISFFMHPTQWDTFARFHPVMGFQYVALDLLQSVLPAGGGAVPALSLEASIKLPLNSWGYQQSGIDLMSRLLLAWQLGRREEILVDGHIGVAHFARPAVVPEEVFGNLAVPFGASLAWTVSPVLRPTFSVSGMTSLYDVGLRRLDRFTAWFSLGASWQVSDRLAVQMSFSEEFLTFAVADVALHINVFATAGGGS